MRRAECDVREVSSKRRQRPATLTVQHCPLLVATGEVQSSNLKNKQFSLLIQPLSFL